MLHDLVTDAESWPSLHGWIEHSTGDVLVHPPASRALADGRGATPGGGSRA
ncbi:MAG: hypothetical protein L0323_03675 [Planctomycetes bacterium]|nr:hypothetical protein [Planctomycetota bacterium]